jgi:hypothetical protein
MGMRVSILGSLVSGALAFAAAGCVSTGDSERKAEPAPVAQPTTAAPGATPAARAAVRRAITQAIVNHPRYGPKPLLIPRRHYTAASISGPFWGSPGDIFSKDDWQYCVKVSVDNLSLLHPHPIPQWIMFRVVEGINGVSVSGRGVVSTRCEGRPFEPFPELEAVNNLS